MDDNKTGLRGFAGPSAEAPAAGRMLVELAARLRRQSEGLRGDVERLRKALDELHAMRASSAARVDHMRRQAERLQILMSSDGRQASVPATPPPQPADRRTVPLSDRRCGAERRSGVDRRCNVGLAAATSYIAGQDRRSGADRRAGGERRQPPLSMTAEAEAFEEDRRDPKVVSLTAFRRGRGAPGKGSASP